MNCKLSTSWQVFGPLARKDQVDLTQWKKVPKTVSVKKLRLQAVEASETTTELDLAPLFGGAKADKAALVFIPFTIAKDGVFSFGFGADWWFEALIDGQPFLDTLESGNRNSTPSFTDFIKEIKLKKGEHLLTVRVISGTGGFRLCLAPGKEAELKAALREKTSTLVDFAADAGTVKALHGVNNGPVSFGSLIDVSANYRELAIPWVRIHDPNWPHPREVDIPQIFPDEDADPEDPANYDFSRTDTYIKSIVDVGAKIVYRLGTSIEHTKIKYFAHPPKDFKRWAQVCIGIIKHYNHGWANGFHYGISHWEIWNEADNDPQIANMWSGTREQYFELYAAAATAIKKFDPSVKVGGFSVSWVKSPMTTEFLEYCRKHRLPLDFFSWHCYAPAPQIVIDNARLARELLAQYGFTSAESHLNEWNLICSGKFTLTDAGLRREMFENMKNERGASFSASVLIRLQDAGVDVANNYDGQPINLFCGLFDSYGVPQKTYRAFQAFRELLDYPVRTMAQGKDGVDALAVIDAKCKKAAVLLSKFGGDWIDHPVMLQNLPPEIDRYELCVIDRDHQLETVSTGTITDGKIVVKLREYAVVLLRLTSSKKQK